MVRQQQERATASTALALGLAALLALSVTARGQTADTAERYFQQGIARYKEGDLDGAIADFSRAIIINSRPARAGGRRVALSLASSAGGDESLLVHDSFNALAHYNRGVA